ncbi:MULTISPECIES: hypothetical protein [unclassified Corynebacterium]|nr:MULTISPECIES: hypothetical protein [unclassified Corynebacterium]
MMLLFSSYGENGRNGKVHGKVLAKLPEILGWFSMLNLNPNHCDM